IVTETAPDCERKVFYMQRLEKRGDDGAVFRLIGICEAPLHRPAEYTPEFCPRNLPAWCTATFIESRGNGVEFAGKVGWAHRLIYLFSALFRRSSSPLSPCRVGQRNRSSQSENPAHLMDELSGTQPDNALADLPAF